MRSISESRTRYFCSSPAGTRAQPGGSDLYKGLGATSRRPTYVITDKGYRAHRVWRAAIPLFVSRSGAGLEMAPEKASYQTFRRPALIGDCSTLDGGAARSAQTACGPPCF
jgi:hypothetical protein